MKRDRSVMLSYLLAVLVGLPCWFLLLRHLLERFLAEATFDDGFINWCNYVFELPVNLDPKDAPNLGDKLLAGGAQKILIDILIFPLLFWMQRFQAGALEELRLNHSMSFYGAVETIARWVALGFLFLIIPPYTAVLLYHALLQVRLWLPLLWLSSIGFFVFLCFWVYQYPNRRVQYVQRVSAFEKLKRGLPND